MAPDPTTLPPLLTADDVRGRLAALCDRTSQTEVASRAGVTQPMVAEVLAGRKRPGPKLLATLGLEELVMYREVER